MLAELPGSWPNRRVTRLSLLMISLLTGWTGCAASRSPRPAQEANTADPPASAQKADSPTGDFTPCRQESTAACGTPSPPTKLETDQPNSDSAAEGSAPT